MKVVSIIIILSIMTITFPLIDIVTITIVDNWDSNGSEREDSNPSREVTTREVKAEVVLLHYHSFLVPLQCIGVLYKPTMEEYGGFPSGGGHLQSLQQGGGGLGRRCCCR